MTMSKTMTPEQATKEMVQIISELELPMLAQLASHEYDDDVVVPADGTYGALFLYDCRDRFLDWVRREGRFPTEEEAEQEAVGTWAHAESLGLHRMQAFVDLGLYYSQHADVAAAATLAEIQKVLDVAAEEFAVTLTSEYGPRTS
jgi:hypothetical protein